MLLKQQQHRTVRLLVPFNDEGTGGVIRIVADGIVEEYYLDRIASDFGEAYLVERIGEDSPEHRYECSITTAKSGRGSGCTCKGKRYYGRCRHEGALCALKQRGKI